MKLNIFLLLLSTLFLFACNKEANLLSITSNTTLQALIIGGGDIDEDKDDKEDKGKEECFELVYPLDITMPDGSVVFGDEEELWGAVKAWYETNPNSEEKPSLNYPVDVIFDKDTIKTINDEEEMEEAKKYCDTNKEYCFKLVYPITWTMPDGTTITINTEEDEEAVKTWYEVNPNTEEKPTLNYPVDIIFDDETIQTIDEEEEMESIKADCG